MKSKKISFVLLVLFLAITAISCQFLEFDSEMSDLKANTDSCNEVGLNLMDQKEYEKALDCFKQAEKYAEEYDSKKDSEYEKDTAGVLLSNVYNNLCYCYYDLESYDLSLEYGEKAVGVEPNDDIEYSNLGNTLYALDRNDEAMEYYEKAIGLNKKAAYAYYGKGSIHYDAEEYDEALAMFNQYETYVSDDIDAKKYIIYCYFYLNNYTKALELADTALVNQEDDIELYGIKGEILSASKSYEEAKKYYEDLDVKFPNELDAQLEIGEFYYNSGQYQLALEVFQRYNNLHKDAPDSSVDSWIITCYGAMEDVDQALAYYQEAVDAGRESSQIYNSMGNVYLNLYFNMESIEFFDEAIRIAPEEPDAYFNKVYALFNSRRYTRCIDFGEDSLDMASAYNNIPWYLGECYYNLYDYGNAISYYEKALELDPENDEIQSSIGYSYLMLEDYNFAGTYADKSLAANPVNETAASIKEEIKNRQQPINKQLKTFIKENYLYYNDMAGLDADLEQYFKDADMTVQEIQDALEQVKQKDDIFTFVLTEEEYDYYYNENAQDVETYIDGDIIYIRIYSFNINTDNKVIEILDSIENAQQKTLAIDLRSNGGGLTQCANNILDVLLSENVTSTLIDREGYTYNYYSDASQLKFDKIYVFVDDYTASSSELLTLGLKTYLNNVTVVGRNTYGKGVGQIVFEDKERKLMLFLVNFYWNVRQQNIMSTSITPDIWLESDLLEDYLNIIKNK